jgi:hypothetical protein
MHGAIGVNSGFGFKPRRPTGEAVTRMVFGSVDCILVDFFLVILALPLVDKPNAGWGIYTIG